MTILFNFSLSLDNKNQKDMENNNKKPLSPSELFSVCIHNQEVFKAGAQDIADILNALLEDYIEKNLNDIDKSRIYRAMSMYIEEERPLQDIWNYLDPNDD